MDILVNTYLRDAGAVNISADMWKYRKALEVDDHFPIRQVLIETLEIEALSQFGKSTKTIS